MAENINTQTSTKHAVVGEQNELTDSPVKQVTEVGEGGTERHQKRYLASQTKQNSAFPQRCKNIQMSVENSQQQQFTGGAITGVTPGTNFIAQQIYDISMNSKQNQGHQMDQQFAQAVIEQKHHSVNNPTHSNPGSNPGSSPGCITGVLYPPNQQQNAGKFAITQLSGIRNQKPEVYKGSKLQMSPPYLAQTHKRGSTLGLLDQQQQLQLQSQPPQWIGRMTGDNPHGKFTNCDIKPEVKQKANQVRQRVKSGRKRCISASSKGEVQQQTATPTLKIEGVAGGAQIKNVSNVHQNGANSNMMKYLTEGDLKGNEQNQRFNTNTKRTRQDHNGQLMQQPQQSDYYMKPYQTTGGAQNNRQLVAQNNGQLEIHTKNSVAISQPVSRQKQASGLRETASCKSMDSGGNASQHLNRNNFNSLRNSKQLNRKMSSTASKRNKKLKKSESQVRHQQKPKIEPKNQQTMQTPDERVSNRTHPSYALKGGIGNINITQSIQAQGATAAMQIQKIKTNGNRADFIKSYNQAILNGIPSIQANTEPSQRKFTVNAGGGGGVGLDQIQSLQMAMKNNQQKEGGSNHSTAYQPLTTIDSVKNNNNQPVFGQSGQKTYKLMKSAERGEINTHNFVMCSHKHDKKSNGIVQSGLNENNPCSCTPHSIRAQQQQQIKASFQSKASQNFQTTFRKGNFVQNSGGRRSNDFSTIQSTSKQSGPFSGTLNANACLTQGNSTSAAPREEVNPANAQQTQQVQYNLRASQHQQVQQVQSNNNSSSSTVQHPMLSDLLKYLQQAYQNQQEPKAAEQVATATNTTTVGSSEQSKQLVQQLMQQQQQAKQALAEIQKAQQPSKAPADTMQSLLHQQTQSSSAVQKGSAAAAAAVNNKLVHFEKGDRIIYEPNEMHQLKYINDKGDMSPITGVQYILTQPNFSKGRPCHFFVVNKQEFEAATKGFAQKSEEQKAEELAKQRKLQAMANIRSHRASQKLAKPQNSSAASTAQKGKRGLERRASAKGSREAGKDCITTILSKEAKEKVREEEKKEEKEKYHNEHYTYQKLRSLKWMGGPYRQQNDDSAPIWRPSAEEQEIRQQLEAKREIKAKYNLLSLNKTGTSELYKYILVLGNNCDVVKRVMESRPSWAQIKSSQTLYNFKWAPSSRQIKFDFLGKHGQKHLVNHFENHALITTKDQLIDSVGKLCENLHQDMFDQIPVTFVIDLATPLCQHEFDKFCQYYHMVEKYKEQYLVAADEDAKGEILGRMNHDLQQHQSMNERKRKSTTMTMRETLFNGHNLWLFKPADANRGRGVNVFNTVDQLKKLILEHTSRADSKQFQTFAATNNLHGAAGGASPLPQASVSQSMDQTTLTSASAQTQQTQAQSQPGGEKPAIHTNIKADVFVLQKYIERPLLICQRKFDIRLWVLVTPEHKCYYFKEGYIRMSGQAYDLNQVDNIFVHLTNNAIQKHGTNYGQFEEGNILSFKEGSDFCKKDGIDVDFHQIYKDGMVPIIETTLMSVRQKINKNNRKYCMEIFGYDFMVDSAMRPWLIEVNTNPCLEESNQLLRQLIPRMLDDAFKLTLDMMFPPLTPAKIAEALVGCEEDEPIQNRPTIFPVPGYTDDENLWGEQPFYILRVPGHVVVQGS